MRFTAAKAQRCLKLEDGDRPGVVQVATDQMSQERRADSPVDRPADFVDSAEGGVHAPLCDTDGLLSPTAESKPGSEGRESGE
jgi:hypothetical protein